MKKLSDRRSGHQRGGLIRFPGAYLVHVQLPTLVVKASVELVQHGNHLHGRAARAHGREAHDVGEQHGDAVKLLGRHRVALPQLLGHGAREDGEQEVHRPLLLLLQGLVGVLQRRLGLPQALLQAVLGLGLLPDQHHVAQGVVDGDVGEVQAAPRQLLQLVHARGAQEEDGVGLGHKDHLALQVHRLAGEGRGERAMVELLNLLECFQGINNVSTHPPYSVTVEPAMGNSQDR